MRGETLEMIYGIPMGILPQSGGCCTCEFCLLMSGLPLISRRRLLTAMALSPLLWQMNTAHAAAIDPNRIVALEWLPVRITAGARHRALRRGGYHQLSPVGQAEPPLPDSVIDVGLRTEPNLELLTEMKPSFMVWSAGYGPSPEMLARIAPGRGFNFSDGKPPLAMARKSLTEMAVCLTCKAQQETHLKRTMRDFIRSMETPLCERGEPPLLLTTLIDPRGICWFRSNSLFQEILDEYSIPKCGKETNFWGGTAVSIRSSGGV